MIFYFSGCGNSRFVAETLAERLDETLYFIPEELRNRQPLRYEPGKEEALGFVFPVYSWGPPSIVMQFVEQMELQGTPSYVYMVCTAGDEVGRTPEILSAALRRKGLQLQGQFSVLMPETYINLPGFTLDTPENEQRKINAARTQLPKIATAIKSRSTERHVTVGTMPWLKSRIIRPLFKNLMTIDKPFHSLDSCVSCGLCQQICPVQNITLEEGRPVWHHHCLCCMACYHHCPQNAIHFGKQTLGKGQYYFGHTQG